jgi:hypothetical protein
MRFKGFIGASYTLRSVNVDCQRCVNLYPEIDEVQTGKAGEVAALQSTPGLTLLATIGTSGAYRGAHVAGNGVLYVVIGNTLYSVSISWNATALGTLLTSIGMVSIDDNTASILCVVDGEYGYSWDWASSTFTQITDAIFTGFGGATQVAYVDTQFVFIAPTGNTLFLSPQNWIPGVAFDGTQFATTESKNDSLLAIVNSHENIWLFGSEHAEVWYDAGNAYPVFPYNPISGGILEYGTVAAFSLARMNQTVLWLGADDKGHGIVYMANGYQPTRISTHAVEDAIQGYSTLADAVGYCYQSNGHTFYVLNFTAGNATWVYDLTTQLWHERAYNSSGQLGRHRGQVHAFAYGVHVVGDYQNGNLYQLDENGFYDNGNAITRMRAAPHLTDGLKHTFYSSFQLDMQVGVGLDGIAQGTNPQVILQWSDDGGYTWSNEKWAPFGAIGQRKTRALWRRLGKSRDRVFRVIITDPVRVCLLGAEIMSETGMS